MFCLKIRHFTSDGVCLFSLCYTANVAKTGRHRAGWRAKYTLNTPCIFSIALLLRHNTDQSRHFLTHFVQRRLIERREIP